MGGEPAIPFAASPLQHVLDLLFPPRCVACRRAGAVLCAWCLAGIERVQSPVCAVCGQSLPSAQPGAICPTARAHRSLDPLTSVRVAANYQGVTRTAIRALKYSGQKRVAVPLGQLLAAAYRAAGWEADLIVPLPLHAKRVKTRGYNQSLLLARALSAQIGVPVRDDLLERWRETAPQVGLGATERHANVDGAFRLRESGKGKTGDASAWLAGKRILLIDDVTTTGSTLAAAGAALAQAGPHALFGLAVARPLLSQDT